MGPSDRQQLLQDIEQFLKRSKVDLKNIQFLYVYNHWIEVSFVGELLNYDIESRTEWLKQICDNVQCYGILEFQYEEDRKPAVLFTRFYERFAYAKKALD